MANNPQIKLNLSPSEDGYVDNSEAEYFQSLHLKSHIESNTDISSPCLLNLPASQFSSNPFPSETEWEKQPKETKVKVHQYGNDWHIKSALTVLSIAYKANKLRSDPVPVSVFYNSLVDYVNIRLDFDSGKATEELDSKATNPCSLSYGPS